jgi:hypothetical protein
MILYILIVCFLEYGIRKSKENQEELEVYFSLKLNKILAIETEDSKPLNHNQPPNTILSSILPSLRLKIYCQKLQCNISFPSILTEDIYLSLTLKTYFRKFELNIIFRSILTEHISLISHVHHLFTNAKI